ncbi:tetratricopeptide repeat protein [Hansschlegelia sp.]|uniref:tetratricopeptide repeat protein n=1 Tax=Hansschlegelia sp. TaxID=2041892 RepID=UPI002B9EF4C5|nr:tetratricopeptide repeat protein [Hansschlegelia sp.]HVI28708.1 tetratricopeptide repeat protein [Hansschlegelia sp.]
MTAAGPVIGRAIARAQLEWAQIQLDGLGGKPQDPAAALAWYRSAARLGDERAINMLGRAYERGWGTRVDLQEAARCYERAAALGEPWALFNLADLTLGGRGRKADPVAAYALYERAAAAGIAKAFNMMGLLRESGEGAPRDAALAKTLFRHAAEGGDCWGCFNYARRLADDDGDIDGAEIWLRRGIELGFPDFWRVVGEALAAHPVPRLAELGRAASRRCADSFQSSR